MSLSVPGLVLLSATLALVVTGCAGEVTSTSFSQEEAKYDAFLQAELSPSADSAALVDEYAQDPLAGAVRGGGDPSRLIIFLLPTATEEQVRELQARVSSEAGVGSVAVMRGVKAPAAEFNVPGQPPSASPS